MIEEIEEELIHKKRGFKIRRKREFKDFSNSRDEYWEYVLV